MENAFEMIENLTEELGEKEQRIMKLEKELKDAMRIINFHKMNRPSRKEELKSCFGVFILPRHERFINELSEHSYNELGKMLKTAKKEPNFVSREYNKLMNIRSYKRSEQDDIISHIIEWHS